jgi:hypothetical protein
MNIYGLEVGISIVFFRYSANFPFLRGGVAPFKRPQGVRKPEIHNLCPPCPKDASYQI